MVKHGKRFNGCLDTCDNRDYKIVAQDNINLPNSADLRKYCTQVKKNDNIIYPNTHIVLTSLETMMNVCIMNQNPKILRSKNKNYYIKEYVKKNHNDFFSEMSLYDNTRRMFPKSNKMPYRHILKTAQKYGCVVQDENLNKDFVANYKIKSYAKINSTGSGKTDLNKKQILTDIKSVLASNVPVITTLKLPTIAKNSKNGLFDYKYPHNILQPVLIVGYNDNYSGTKKGYFIYQNLWGHTWGDKGFGYLPYKCVKENKQFDMWVITEFEFSCLDKNKYDKLNFSSKDPQCYFDIKYK